ncbi:MAG: YraN family protein [Pseudomonadales bacterium]
MPGQPNTQSTGRWAEDQALAHLQRHGLRLLSRNFRCRLGEIDLIMADGSVIVFVEVRFRRDVRFGEGFDTVTRSKQRKLLATARAYLARRTFDNPACRFDVVSVTQRHYAPDLLWLKDAFDQDG